MQTISIEVTISQTRPYYSTECEYTADVSDEDYELLTEAGDWSEVPDELYNNVFSQVMEQISDELIADGSMEEGDDPEAMYDIELGFPDCRNE